MENQDLQNDEMWRKMEKGHRRAKIFGGFLVVLAGVLFLARETGAELPYWLFSWKTLLIAIGLVSGVRHSFRRPGWAIMVLIGGAFLLADFFPGLTLRPFLWPVLLILLGLFIIFKPSRRKYYAHCRGRWQGRWRERYERGSYSATGEGPVASSVSDDYLDSMAVFGGVKKNILSKKFKGGELTNVFGGTELDLSQADFEDGIELEITQVFGGTKLIIPANWEIRSDIVTILGGMEDKRPVQPGAGSTGPVKKLTLSGTTIFGGIEIKSY